MDFIVKVRLPDELLDRCERAAESLGLTPNEYLRIALEEKVHHWGDDFARKQKFEAITRELMEKNAEVYRRLAEWPEDKQ